MKHLLSTTVLGFTLALAACGGSSDSSGDTSATTDSSTNTAPAATTPTTDTKGNACAVSGKVVTATASGCTFSSPGINGGADVTYTCSGGRVSSSIGISAQTINLNGIKIQCPA